jgi:hypothetical protein
MNAAHRVVEAFRRFNRDRSADREAQDRLRHGGRGGNGCVRDSSRRAVIQELEFKPFDAKPFQERAFAK